MGELIAVEGLDGAGKNTLVSALRTEWESQGARVATLTFPRYGRAITADLAAEALRGDHGDLRDSVSAMAIMFALDRLDAVDEITTAVADHDVVVLDRYVASNAAYSAARLHQDADGEVVAWIDQLEFDRFRLPVPEKHVLLGVPAELAMNRATTRAAADADRQRDFYERNSDLQLRVDTVYRALAARSWRSLWVTIDDVPPAELARDLLTK